MMTKPDTPTPAASGAAPADLRDAFERWYCQDAASKGCNLPDGIADLRDGDEYGDHRVALNCKWLGWQGHAALASREASNASLVDEDLHKFLDAAGGEGLVLDGVDAGDLYVRLYPYRCGAALASPQVAPAEADAWLMTRPSGTKWAAVLDESGRRAHELDGCTVQPLFLAAPVQVDPASPFEPVGATEHLHELNDEWAQHLKAGVTLYVKKEGACPYRRCSGETAHCNGACHGVSPDGIALATPVQVAPQDDARDAAEETCDRCNGSGDQEYLVGGGPDAHDETGPCSKCGGSGVMPRGVPVEALIAAIKHQIKHAKDKRVQLAPSFWGHDRGAGLPLSELEDVILEWESQGGCEVPPPGWWCSRVKGHDGPCAARPVTLSTPAAKPTEEQGS